MVKCIHMRPFCVWVVASIFFPSLNVDKRQVQDTSVNSFLKSNKEYIDVETAMLTVFLPGGLTYAAVLYFFFF